ncbi:MAG: heme-binding protein, partial [Pseudomonadota bacterium]
GALFSQSAMAVEEPPFETIVKDGKFEVRRYGAQIVAEVEVEADRGGAPNAGFRPLANYIFGGNIARDKIEMTAPVTQKASQKIEMTAPVTQAQSAAGNWTIAFIMPEAWTLETLPIPDDPAVTLRETAPRLVATVRFAGRARPDAQKEQQAELETWLETQGYRAIGGAEVAFYNAPYVPGPFRRNEVIIPIEALSAVE